MCGQFVKRVSKNPPGYPLGFLEPIKLYSHGLFIIEFTATSQAGARITFCLKALAKKVLSLCIRCIFFSESGVYFFGTFSAILDKGGVVD